MNFTWPDPFSLIADIITFCCVPTLTVATIALWKQVKEAREMKIVDVGRDTIKEWVEKYYGSQ